MRRPRAVAAVLLVAAACGGPTVPLEVGGKEIPVDIVLGAQGSPPPPPPALAPNPGFPGFIQPPIPRIEPGPQPTPAPLGACPAANPLDPAVLVARKQAPLPPVPATYSYRNRGTFQVGDGPEVAYPRTMTRAVGGVRAIEGDNYEFDVTTDLASVRTTTRYRSLNSGLTPDRGLYIVQVTTERASGTESFTPDTPILLMPFVTPEYGTNVEDEIDRYRGEQYRSSGTDPLTQTTMVLEAAIRGKERVNACGRWVDAFDIEVTRGTIVGPTKQIDFTGRYAIATQYGGLVVRDDIRITGTEGPEAVVSRLRSTINRLPVPPDASAA